MAKVATKNERERLEALYRYKILDTASEEEFDDISRLAAGICGTPVAMINLIDKDRQWAKSMLGMPESAREMERSNAVCQYTIESDKPLEIQDLTKDPRFADYSYVKSEDGLRYYLGAPLVNPDGHILGALCVLDYETRSMSESQLNQLEILARVVITRLELKRKNDQLNQLNNYKIKLMKMLSHDLRSPLNGIVGMAGILKSMVDDGDSKQAEMLDLIEQSGQQMNQMISEIMNYTLIESQEFTLNRTKIRVGSLLESIEKLYKPAAQLKNIKLLISDETDNKKVLLDEEKIEHILGNLLSNAIKYTKSGGRVEVNVSIKLMDDQCMLVLKVSDNGIGMDEKKIANLFSKENKLITSGTNGEKSNGIGLTIIKAFLDLHGGEIYVESTPGKGTTFKVDIPV